MSHSLPWKIALVVPGLFAGAAFHRAALAAVQRREFALAERLFERAASRYRAELRVEPLARLRVHQEIARLRALQHPHVDTARCLEVERALTRLDLIEALESPFELVEAKSVLATWLSDGGVGQGRVVEQIARAA